MPDTRGLYREKSGPSHKTCRFQPADQISMTRERNCGKTYCTVCHSSVTVTGRQSNLSMSLLCNTAVHETRIVTQAVQRQCLSSKHLQPLGLPAPRRGTTQRPPLPSSTRTRQGGGGRGSVSPLLPVCYGPFTPPRVPALAAATASATTARLGNMAVRACDVRKQWGEWKAGPTFSSVKPWRVLAEGGGLADSWQRWKEASPFEAFSGCRHPFDCARFCASHTEQSGNGDTTSPTVHKHRRPYHRPVCPFRWSR